MKNFLKDFMSLGNELRGKHISLEMMLRPGAKPFKI